MVDLKIEHIKTRKVKKLLYEAAFNREMIEIYDEETGTIYDAEVVKLSGDEVELILHVPVKWKIEKLIGKN